MPDRIGNDRKRQTVGELDNNQVNARRERLMALPFRTSGARVLAEAWLDFAGDRLAPARTDIDPARLVEVLPNIVILEYRPPSEILFRLAGTDFFTTFDREVTGESYLDVIETDQRDATRRRLYSLVEYPCGLIAILGRRADDEDRMKLESFGLPVRNSEGRIAFTLHHADYLETVEDIRRISMNELRALQAQWVDIGRGAPGHPPPL